MTITAANRSGVAGFNQRDGDAACFNPPRRLHGRKHLYRQRIELHGQGDRRGGRRENAELLRLPALVGTVLTALLRAGDLVLYLSHDLGVRSHRGMFQQARQQIRESVRCLRIEPRVLGCLWQMGWPSTIGSIPF